MDDWSSGRILGQGAMQGCRQVASVDATVNEVKELLLIPEPTYIPD